MTTDQYNRLIKRFTARLQALAKVVRREFVDQFFDCSEVWEQNGDTYSWNFAVNPDANVPHMIAVDFAIVDAQDYDGDKYQHHCSFSTDIVEVPSGRIVGNFHPYNYSPKVWVSIRDKDAVKTRFNEFAEGCDPMECVALIKNFVKERREESDAK